MKRLWLVLPLCLLACSALRLQPGSKYWFDNDVNGKRELLKRASLVMACNEGQLATTSAGLVGKGATRDDYRTVEVRGCGQTATYVYLEYRGWVLSDVTERKVDSPIPGQESPPPPPTGQ
jgi:hypothetical protein